MDRVLTSLLSAPSLLGAASPTPSPAVKAEDVSPGTVGFIVTALLAVVTILLIVSMARKIRRVRYREQVRQEFEGPDEPLEERPRRGRR
ncbi:hypothetical protein H9I38_04060 [Arthrobacter sp. UM1]|nr:hypothetical protein [Arthrobacter sp. UM1]